MSSLTRAELDRSLKSGKISSLYLLHGCETFLRDAAADAISDVALSGTLIREFNESTFSLLSSTPVEAIAAAEQLPMMSERRVVKIKDFAKLRDADEEVVIRYVQKPVDQSVVIFLAGDLDKRKKLTKTLLSEATVIEFAPVKDAEAKSWARTRLKSQRINASERVLTEIIALVGTDLQTLATELDKLGAAAVETKDVTLDMVDQLIGRSRELSNFDLGDQLIAGDRERALSTLHRLLEDDVPPVMLVGLIAGNYHRLALAKELMNRGRRDEAQGMVYGPQWKRDAFMRTLQQSDSTKIARGLQLIAEADLAIKTSQATPRLQLEMLVCQLAG